MLFTDAGCLLTLFSFYSCSLGLTIAARGCYDVHAGINIFKKLQSLETRGSSSNNSFQMKQLISANANDNTPDAAESKQLDLVTTKKYTSWNDTHPSTASRITTLNQLYHRMDEKHTLHCNEVKHNLDVIGLHSIIDLIHSVGR